MLPSLAEEFFKRRTKISFFLESLEISITTTSEIFKKLEDLRC